MVAESEAVPDAAVPMSRTLCGLLPEELMVTVPPRVPPAVGVKVMLMVQFLPAASVPAQVFVWE